MRLAFIGWKGVLFVRRKNHFHHGNQWQVTGRCTWQIHQLSFFFHFSSGFIDTSATVAFRNYLPIRIYSRIYGSIFHLAWDGDSLRVGRSGDRFPVGARFFAPFQTGPEAYPASCTMGTGSFPGVKRQGRGADHPPPSKRRGHERVGLYLYSPFGSSWPVIGRTFFNFIFHVAE